MSSPLPTKMSLFENVTSLSTASYIIGLDVYAGQLANIKISGSAAGYELSRKRWIINPPVTSSTDPRGADGAESYATDGKYWIKSGSVWVQMVGSGSAGGAGGGTISSSAQLSDGGGEAFTIANNVTFGRINAGKVTASFLETENTKLGSVVGSLHSITGSVYITGSTVEASTSTGWFRLVNSRNYLLYGNNGTASDVAFGWLGDGDTGIYRIGNNDLGFSANGDLKARLSSAGFFATGSLSGSATHATTASYALNSTTSSYALNSTTGSYALNSTTSSYALNSNTSSYASSANTSFAYNVKDFGAVGDDSTNDTSAILSAINSAQSSGMGTVYFPDGIYRITGSLSLPNNPQCDIALVGNGSNVSIIKQTANVNGVEFNMDNGGTGDQIYQISIKGLGFTTSGVASSSIYITYGTSSVSAHENISVDLHDVQVLSDNTNYWSKGIVLESAWNFRITNCMIVGRPLGSFYQGTGLEMRRLCVNGTVNQTQFNFWHTGIYVNSVDYTSTGQNTEGLLLNQIYMVPVVYGIYAKGNKSFFAAPFNSYDWANRPIAGRIALLTLNNSHIDSRNSGSALWLENVQSHYISNNLLISDNTGSVVNGINAHEGTFIGNTLFNAGSAPSIYIGGYSGSANIITGNVFRGGSTQVLLESSSIYNKVYGNVAYDTLTISLSNLGTNNLTGSVGY
jgi:hypothetical protein